MSRLPLSLMNRLNKTKSAVFKLWMLYFQRIFFTDYFGTKLYRQIVGTPMGTNCTLLIADLFLFCYERDFMKYLSQDK